MLTLTREQQKGRRCALLAVRDANRVVGERLEACIALGRKSVAAAGEDPDQGSPREIFGAERQGGANDTGGTFVPLSQRNFKR